MNKYSKAYFMLKEEKLKSIINKKKSVIAVAEDMNVSRQTIHKWLCRYKRFGKEGILPQKRKIKKKVYNKTDPILTDFIIKVAEEY